MMISRNIRRLLSFRQWSHDDGSAVTAQWIKSGDRAVLFNPGSGAVIADMIDCGKYETTVFLSPLEAFRLIRRRAGFLVSLRTFPRITLALRYIHADSLSEAQEALLEILGIAYR